MVAIVMRSRFSAAERRAVRVAERRAAELVSAFYVLSPREWSRMPYEVRTTQQLTPTERHIAALAEVRCYGVRRTVGERVLAEHDLYRICLNDERILAHAGHREQARCHRGGDAISRSWPRPPCRRRTGTRQVPGSAAALNRQGRAIEKRRRNYVRAARSRRRRSAMRTEMALACPGGQVTAKSANR